MEVVGDVFGRGTLHGCCVVCVVSAVLLSSLLLLLTAVVLRLSSDVANGGCGAAVKCVIPQSVLRHSHYAGCNVVKMASRCWSVVCLGELCCALKC
jgi:hypothetical protein